MDTSTQPARPPAASSLPRRTTLRSTNGNANGDSANGGKSDSVRGTKRRSYPAYFVLWAPEARQVSVVGHFNDWDPTALPLKRDGDGCWVAEVELPPGGHEYLFVADGQRIPDPEAQSVPDGAGRMHSILMVPPARLRLRADFFEYQMQRAR